MTEILNNPMPPNTPWYLAALMALMALGKPIVDAVRNYRTSSQRHAQQLEVREVTAREQEDRELILLLKGEIKDLKERMGRMEVINSELNKQNSELQRENAILKYRLGELP